MVLAAGTVFDVCGGIVRPGLDRTVLLPPRLPGCCTARITVAGWLPFKYLSCRENGYHYRAVGLTLNSLSKIKGQVFFTEIGGQFSSQ